MEKSHHHAAPGDALNVPPKPVKWTGSGRQRPGGPFVLRIPKGLYSDDEIRAARSQGLLVVVEGGRN